MRDDQENAAIRELVAQPIGVEAAIGDRTDKMQPAIPEIEIAQLLK